ncbi:MAG: hypothetical protein LBC02_09000, partial [Planctomycetaceae bacterium]|nr:hypothetical protein [Planctomycetaceae bacterium]
MEKSILFDLMFLSLRRNGSPFGFSQTGTMISSLHKFSVFQLLIGFAFTLIFGQFPIAAQSTIAEPPKIASQPQTSEPTVYRVRSQQVREIEKQLQLQFARDPNFSVTIKPDFEPDTYRVCVLATESIHQKIPEILQQYATLLPKNGGKSLVYIEPRPVPVFQSQQHGVNPATNNPNNPNNSNSFSVSPASPQYSVPIAMPSAPPRPAETEMIRPASVATTPATTIPATTISATAVPVTTVQAAAVPATTVPAATVPVATVPAATVSSPLPVLLPPVTPPNSSGLVQTLPQPLPADPHPNLYGQTQPLANMGQAPSLTYMGQTLPLNDQAGNENQLRDSFTPTNVSMAQIEQTIRFLLGAKIAEMSPNRLLISVERNHIRRHCTLDIDRDNNRFLIVGDRTFCDQLVQLINAIDQPEPQHGWERRFVPISNAKPESIAKIMELCRSPKRLEPKLKGTMFEPVPPTPNDPYPRMEFRRNETHRLPPPTQNSVPNSVQNSFQNPVPTQAQTVIPTAHKQPELSKTTKHLDPRRNPVIQLVGYQFENSGSGIEGGGASGGVNGNNNTMPVNGQDNPGMEVVSDFR